MKSFSYLGPTTVTSATAKKPLMLSLREVGGTFMVAEDINYIAVTQCTWKQGVV